MEAKKHVLVYEGGEPLVGMSGCTTASGNSLAIRSKSERLSVTCGGGSCCPSTVAAIQKSLTPPPLSR